MNFVRSKKLQMKWKPSSISAFCNVVARSCNSMWNSKQMRYEHPKCIIAFPCINVTNRFHSCVSFVLCFVVISIQIVSFLIFIFIIMKFNILCINTIIMISTSDYKYHTKPMQLSKSFHIEQQILHGLNLMASLFPIIINRHKSDENHEYSPFKKNRE